jgi:hypothetical protein
MQFKKAMPLFPVLPLVLLGGCSTLTPGVIDPSAVIKSVPRVHNSPSAPCWQQKEIAAQNAWIDTATGINQKAAYAAPCELQKPQTQPRIASADAPKGKP